MLFKSEILKRAFSLLDTRAQVIAYALDGFCRDNFSVEITITSIYREESPTHSNFCALDVRIKPDYGKAVFTKAQVLRIKVFSKTIIYDTDRLSKPTIYIHSNKSGKGKHMHIQVYPGKTETILRNIG